MKPRNESARFKDCSSDFDKLLENQFKQDPKLRLEFESAVASLAIRLGVSTPEELIPIKSIVRNGLIDKLL